MKIKYNYHTHTKRCGHAYGDDEDYVLRAIKDGYLELGFSDHVMLPGISQPGIRGEFVEAENYLNSINYLKEKYKDEIKIYRGFECEYFPKFASYYKSLLNSKKVDYLILGQHFYMDENDQIISCTFRATNIEESEKHYIDFLLQGMASGLFKYVAHPDLFCILRKEWGEDFEELSKRICEASLKYNIPLEINLCRTESKDKEKWKYPREEFWKIAGEYGVRVVIGADAHYPEMLDIVAFDRAFELIEKYKLKYEEKMKI
ncbi:MAG: histidinol-phosphatase [Bacilli bacterium]|nr:histidinol-phosphatase [Bacilli bacterium]